MHKQTNVVNANELLQALILQIQEWYPDLCVRLDIIYNSISIYRYNKTRHIIITKAHKYIGVHIHLYGASKSQIAPTTSIDLMNPDSMDTLRTTLDKHVGKLLTEQ